MRDPKRIPRILNLLEEYWSRYPDLRLCQIMGNFSPDSARPVANYHVEDEVIEQAMFEHLRQLLTPTKHRERAPETYKGKFKFMPRVGEIVWVRPGDDHHGGWGIISQVLEQYGSVCVRLEELPSITWNWQFLEPEQKRLQKDYPHRTRRDDR